jgi:hypothetical protein
VVFSALVCEDKGSSQSCVLCKYITVVTMSNRTMLSVIISQALQCSAAISVSKPHCYSDSLPNTEYCSVCQMLWYIYYCVL